MNKKYLTIPVAIIAVVLICITVYLGLSKDKTNESTEQSSENPKIEVVEEEENPTDEIDINALKEENEDIYGWIRVPNTTIDYPILQSEQDDYYLDHTVEGTEGLPGAIYTNKEDGIDFNRANTTIYGHNMNDGSYFGQLHLYEDADFFARNREVEIYLADKKMIYQIIAASRFNDSYLPEAYLMENPIGVGQFLDDLKNYSPDDKGCHFAQSLNVDSGEKIITLSTCIKGASEERYLVVAKLTTVEDYE